MSFRPASSIWQHQCNTAHRLSARLAVGAALRPCCASVSGIGIRGGRVLPTLKLTAQNVPTFKASPEGRRAVYRDSLLPGLYLEVHPSGVRTFGVWYRVRGSRRAGRMTLGRYLAGVYGLADARDDARDVLHSARKGADPAEQRRRDREAGTFGDLVDAFLLDARGRLAPATFKEWERMARHGDLAGLRTRKPPEITRGDLIRLLDKVAQRAPYQANHVLAFVRRIFSWALSKDLVPATPCVGIVKPATEKPRTRAYTDNEVRTILAALDGGGKVCDAIRLVFYRGVRIEQALGAPWSEVDFDRQEWHIAGEDRKSVV